MNTAWALGEVVGPTAGGALAETAAIRRRISSAPRSAPLTLAATYRVAGRMRPREA